MKGCKTLYCIHNKVLECVKITSLNLTFSEQLSFVDFYSMTQFKILPSSPLVVIFGTNGILMWQSEKNNN